MTQEQELLQTVYDVLAHNTQYEKPTAIIDEYSVEIDYNANTIGLFNEDTDETIATLAMITPDKLDMMVLVPGHHRPYTLAEIISNKFNK